MLFVLTGDVQIGKTRWLTSLVDELRHAGVGSEGVLAPGVWRQRSEAECAALASAGVGTASADMNADEGVVAGAWAASDAPVAAPAASVAVPASPAAPVAPAVAPDAASANLSSGRGLGGTDAFEKLGIDNKLLPDGPVIPFARRRDLARREGTYDEASQSARIGMGWEISDKAIAQVNAYFSDIFDRVWHKGGSQAGSLFRVAGGGSACADAASGGMCGSSACGKGEAGEIDACAAGARLLVVDELGRLELEHGMGLDAALRLLDVGPTPCFPHALVVVRSWLLPAARERFEPVWGEVCTIGPNDVGRASVLSAFGVEP